MRHDSQQEPDDRKLDRIVEAATNAASRARSPREVEAAIRDAWALVPVFEPLEDWWYPSRRPANRSSCVHVILRSSDPYKQPDRFGPYWEWRVDLEIWNLSMDYYGEGTLTDQYPTHDLDTVYRQIEGALMIIGRTDRTAGAAAAWHEHAATRLLTPEPT